MIKKIMVGFLTVLVCLLSVGGSSASNPPGVALTTGNQRAVIVVTQAVTIPPHRLVLLWVSTGEGMLVVSDPSRVWNMVQSASPGERRLTLFESLSDITTTGAVTLTTGRGTNFAWSIVEYPATQVVQSRTGNWKLSGLSDHSIALADPGDGGFTVAGYLFPGLVKESLLPGDGYQFTGDVACSLICIQAEAREGFADKADMRWDCQCHWAGIVAALK